MKKTKLYFQNNRRVVEDFGVQYVGGCCGTGPLGIQRLAEEFKSGMPLLFFTRHFSKYKPQFFYVQRFTFYAKTHPLSLKL